MEFATGDGDDTINGFMSKDIISLSGSNYYTKETTNSSVKISLVSGSGSMTLLDASDKTINVEGSTLLNVVINRINSKKITAGNAKDSITNHGNKVTIIGASDMDSICNYSANVSINGGSDNDYIRNFGTDSTLTGGAGNDSIGNYAKGYMNGKLVTENGGKNVKIFGGAGADSIENSGANVTINGGAGNDEIINSGVNVSINGGDGKDTFIYKPGEGTDKIFDFQNNDLLTIINKDGTEGGSFKSPKFSGGDLTLTIKGGDKVIFDGASNVDKFNINGTSYKISGSKLVK